MGDLTCGDCLELSAEVALGAADAEDRAAVLAHVEHCAECATWLRSMTEVGDGLTGLVPPVQPPAGFEARAMAAIKKDSAPAPWVPLGGRLRSRPLTAAAAIAVAALLAAGGWFVGHTTSARPAPVVTATLVSQRSSVGEVVLVPGAQSWISMTVNVGTATADVRCQVRNANGRFVTLGTFTLDHGYGSWAAPLPQGLVVRGARLVTGGGKVLASATFTTG